MIKIDRVRIDEEMKWLEALWENGNRIQSLFFERVAQRLVYLESVIDGVNCVTNRLNIRSKKMISR